MHFYYSHHTSLWAVVALCVLVVSPRVRILGSMRIFRGWDRRGAQPHFSGFAQYYQHCATIWWGQQGFPVLLPLRHCATVP